MTRRAEYGLTQPNGKPFAAARNGEKPGLKGRVVDINLIYTTLQEVDADARDGGSVLQVPNSLFFQRSVRRWRGHEVPARWLAAATTEATAAAEPDPK